MTRANWSQYISRRTLSTCCWNFRRFMTTPGIYQHLSLSKHRMELITSDVHLICYVPFLAGLKAPEFEPGVIVRILAMKVIKPKQTESLVYILFFLEKDHLSRLCECRNTFNSMPVQDSYTILRMIEWINPPGEEITSLKLDRAMFTIK